MATMVPLLLPPSLSTKGERDHPRATLLLLCVLEGRSTPLTLGSLLSLADDNDGDNGVNGCGRGGGWGGGSNSVSGRSLSYLLITRTFLELTDDYHHCQRINRLKSVSECLRINHETGSEEGEEEEVEGGHPFHAAVTAMLNSLELNLTLTAAKVRPGQHWHGEGGEGRCQGDWCR